MSFDVKELSADALAQAKEAYAELFLQAMPHSGGIEKDRLEVAGFNLSSTYEEFQKVGLGLEVVSIFRDESGDGHTGKVLLNLPWQLLLEHGHVDTFVIQQDTEIPEGFINLKDVINDFHGLCEYNSDGSPKIENGEPVYIYKDGPYKILQAENGSTPFPESRKDDLVAIFPGKSETFKAIYGDGVLLSDKAIVLHAPQGVNTDKTPDRFREKIDQVRKEQAITTTREIYMGPGTNVLLPKCTRHAFLAGDEGAVYLEFSTPSMDEADRFTDTRVIR